MKLLNLNGDGSGGDKAQAGEGSGGRYLAGGGNDPVELSTY